VLPNPLPALDAEATGANPTSSNLVALTSVREGAFRDSQRACIVEALHAAGWIVGGPRGAATRLGLKRTTLISKMKKLGISRPVAAQRYKWDEPELPDGAVAT